jgi:Fic family protein
MTVRGRLVPKTWEAQPGLYAPARYRRPCRYDAFVPDLLSEAVLPLEGAVAGVVSDAEARIAELNASARPALAPLARLLLRTESIASSKVEGMQVDAGQLARAEVRRDAGERVGPEVLEILANIDAMRLAVEEASGDGALTIENVLAIHHALLVRARPAIAGRVRDSQNWIGGNDYNPCGAEFVPPPPEDVDALLEDLVAFCRDESLPPLVQAALAHAQFETIHPFEDGNGRAGRALVQVVLRRRGLAPGYVPPISVVLAAERDRYIAGLTAFRQGDESTWIETFAAASAQAAILASHYLGEVGVLQGSWRERLRAENPPRADAAAWAIIDALPAHPVISVPVAVAATGRSKPAISQAVGQLAAAGVLLPLSPGRRNRAWEAAGLLELLAALESGRVR